MESDKDLYAYCALLRARSAALRAEAAALHVECTRIETTCQEVMRDAGGAIYDAPSPTPHDAAMEALHSIRTIIDQFPIEWQMGIVKALTARTILKAQEQARPAPVAISA